MKKFRKLNVLVACEESGTVRDAFRKLGHNAWSCDLQPCSGDSRFHYQGDVFDILSATNLIGGVTGINLPKSWDLLIAHPPCTYLTNAGVCWLYKWVPAGGKVVMRGQDFGPFSKQVINPDRWKKMCDGAHFFAKLWRMRHLIPHVAIENPIMHKHALGVAGINRQDQVVQPWMFGHLEQKATCLWLHDLPQLEPTNCVKTAMMALPKRERNRLHYLPPSPDRAKLRSKTFQGIADAMAEQWSNYILNK